MTVYIICGEKNSGKTRYLREFSEARKAEGRSVAGILAPAEIREGLKQEYYVLDLLTEEKELLVSRKALKNCLQFGDFYFSRKGFDFGSRCIQAGLGSDFLLIDEIGPVELMGKGFSGDLYRVLEAYTGSLYISVRPSILSDVIKAYSLDRHRTAIIKL